MPWRRQASRLFAGLMRSPLAMFTIPGGCGTSAKILWVGSQSQDQPRPLSLRPMRRELNRPPSRRETQTFSGNRGCCGMVQPHPGNAGATHKVFCPSRRCLFEVEVTLPIVGEARHPSPACGPGPRRRGGLPGTREAIAAGAPGKSRAPSGPTEPKVAAPAVAQGSAL